MSIVFNDKGILLSIFESFPFGIGIILMFDDEGKITRRSSIYDSSGLVEKWDTSGKKTTTYQTRSGVVSKEEYQTYIKEILNNIENETQIHPDITRSIIGEYVN